MKFSIVTPSLRQLPWLKRCVRSVADQGGEVEHIVQDAGTGAELEKWVGENSGARLFVGKDSGMYDALNRGFARAAGDVFAYLNCDEQYLPGALARVRRAFGENPRADIVAGDFLMLDAEARLLAFRKITPLHAAMIRTDHLHAYTCAIFFRRRVWESGLRFDERWKTISDGDWVARALEAGHRAVCVREYLAAFAFTGENQSAQAAARAETAQARRALPLWLRAAGPLLRAARHVEKLARGAYRSGPISYEVFAGEDDTARTRFTCEQPRQRYPGA